MRICEIKKCDRPNFSLGLCSVHYHRLRSSRDLARASEKYEEWTRAEGTWRELPQFPGYRICADGTVWTCWQSAGKGRGLMMGDKFREVKQRWKGWYLVVSMPTADGRKFLGVHRLVAWAFIGPQATGMQCCHNDGNRANNTLPNLRYDTAKGNAADKHKHGTMIVGERHSSAKVTAKDVIEIRAMAGKESGVSLARRYGISNVAISAILRRQTWKHVDAV